MKALIRKGYKEEIFNTALKGGRFNLKGGVFDPVTGGNVFSGELVSCFVNVAISAGNLIVYKINRQSIDFLSGKEGVLDRSSYYSLSGEAVSEDNVERLSQYEGGGPWRGSILIESDARDPALQGLIRQCFNPGYISGLKFVMSPGALIKAKKISNEKENRGDKVVVVAGECGLNDFALYFTEKKTLEEVISYSFENSNLSAQFVKSYCETEE